MRQKIQQCCERAFCPDHDPLKGYLLKLALQTDDLEWRHCYPFTPPKEQGARIGS
jgi:hypothetical protein